MADAPPTVNWLRRAGLAACLILSPALLGACTKVVEPPVLEPAPPPPEPVKQRKVAPAAAGGLALSPGRPGGAAAGAQAPRARDRDPERRSRRA